MRISHRHRFYFISIPKTGSETVRSLLNPYSDVLSEPKGELFHHINERQLQSLFERRGWKISDYVGFTTVRNPWARLVSWHNYKMRIGGSPPTPFFQQHAPEFYKKCRLYAAGSGRFLSRVKNGEAFDLPPQTHFMLEGSHSKLRIIRLENLSADLRDIFSQLGIDHEDLEFGRWVNRSTFGDIREEYDDEAVEVVRRVYASDCLRFGYEFETT